MGTCGFFSSFIRNSFLGIRCCFKDREIRVKMIAEVNVEVALNSFLCCLRVEESVTCRSITYWQVVAGWNCRYVALSHGVNPSVRAPTADKLCATIAPCFPYQLLVAPVPYT